MKQILIVCTIVVLGSCNKVHEHDSSTTSKDSLIITNEAILQPSISPQLEEDTIELIPSPYIDSVYLKIKITTKDWWEEIFLVTKNKEYLIPIDAQSVLTARFINLKAKGRIFFEVYDMTHMGNGFYYLFEYKMDTIEKLIEARAVDDHRDGAGLMLDSSLIIKNEKLESSYQDLNKDGFLDVKLSGIGYVFRGDVIEDSIKQSVFMERQFLWNKKTNSFQELVDKRKGFWFYDQYGVDY